MRIKSELSLMADHSRRDASSPLFIAGISKHMRHRQTLLCDNVRKEALK